MMCPTCCSFCYALSKRPWVRLRRKHKESIFFNIVQGFWRSFICLIKTKITALSELGSDCEVFKYPSKLNPTYRSKPTERIFQNQIFSSEKHTMGNLELYAINFDFYFTITRVVQSQTPYRLLVVGCLCSLHRVRKGSNKAFRGVGGS